MQGRLSAMVDGKIQAFPWNEWREEFPRAQSARPDAGWNGPSIRTGCAKTR